MISFVGISDWTRGEYERRLTLWSELAKAGNADGLIPSTIRDLGLYKGQAGIFFDGTGDWTQGSPGRVALTLQHTGSSYADDLTDEHLDYHYPSTQRHASFDRNEIDSVKRTQSLGLPLFVVTPNALRSTLKDVRLGYVDTFDDDAAVFYLSFIESVLPLPSDDELPASEEEVDLFGGLPEQTLRLVQQRTQQRRFKIDVLNRYGPTCALCDITVPRLIQGAHLIPKSIGGADEALNGLPLCLNHHVAFDSFLLRLEPDGSSITYAPGVSKADLHVTRDDLFHLPAAPSASALRKFYRTDAALAAFSSWS
ncbi:HNH endonuclease [Frigoribacterium sp. PhB24]|uniref:HNH endonuclease n=1 Tax=Frigoribacterium sp. PhB24 TaxID=2485204 RepID=UPI000F4A6E13|nr:HNH endonuclease [Frigoribacterium sp. PhB24]ROS54084.1 HNH endonuclease [Frigoribacterium sp. PhB24]